MDEKRGVEKAWESIAYYGDRLDMKRWIAETVARLPNEVAEFVYARCRFLSIGKETWGMVVPAGIGVNNFNKRTKNMWLILLEENLPGSKANARSIIAHEIAHARLGHDRVSCDVPKDCEIKACELARQWGFKGLGINKHWCHGNIEFR